VDHDLVLLTFFLLFAVEAVGLLEKEASEQLQNHIKEQRRLCRSLPLEKRRVTWTGFCNRVSDSHFRRQFRMSRRAFSNLCSTLSACIGEHTFRPEDGLYSTSNAESLQRRGGLVPGEVKVAISLRILAGGSYLDLSPLFEVSSAHIYQIFEQFLDWVLKALEFPLARYIYDENWEALKGISDEFSYGSNGVFSGIIGALDGLAVRIRSPLLTEVSDPGNYYCRKGFFALNVQAICDRSRRFTWVYTSNKGSTHDSVAFTNSRLYSLMSAKAVLLEQQGIYLVGDSAYNLTPFLLVPFSTDEIRNDSGDMCDAFNFFLSSSRINIECAFGELVRRWGILWRTLHFDLAKSQRVVQVCMLLHNYIKNCHENDDDIDEVDWQPRQHPSANNERAFPLVSDNNEQIPRGRRTAGQDLDRKKGETIRRSITVMLQLQGLRRPMHSGMRYNQYGHVFFDG